MANNCLVTKLNGVVDNDNLDLFDTISFTASGANESALFQVQGSPDIPVEISWEGGNLYTTLERTTPRTSPITNSASSQIGFYANEGTTINVKIKGIYNLMGIGFINNLSNIKGVGEHLYYGSLSTFIRDKFCAIKKVGINDINSIELRNLNETIDIALNVSTYTSTSTSLVVQYVRANTLTGVSGSIEGITNRCPNLTRIQLPYTKVIGNIANIGSYDNITHLIISGTGCTGTVESFVEGVATKSTFPSYCYFESYDTSDITLNGNPFRSTVYITKSGNVFSLSTDASYTNVIATYNSSSGVWTYNS